MVTRHTTMVTMVTIDDDIELKPCPFCGSTAGLYVSYFGDENDLIRRGDALRAIRKACISAYLPFNSATPEGQRVMDALYAVWKVKKEGKTHDSI